MRASGRVLDFPYTTAVAIIFYNRPSTLEALLVRLSALGPEDVVFISDGPKDDSDVELVNQCRSLVEKFDWGAKRTLFYGESNRGMYKHVPDSLTEAFNIYEALIILEDDCLPDLRFLEYVSAVANLHKDDTRLAGITGYNPIGFTPWAGPKKYFLSGLFRGWGVLRTRDHHHKFLDFYNGFPSAPRITNSQALWTIWKTPGVLRKLIRAKVVFGNRKRTGPADIWYQLYMQKHGLYMAMPRASLIENKGDGAQATHTRRLPDIKLEEPKTIQFANLGPRELKVSRMTDVLEGYLVTGWLLRGGFF